MSTSISVPNASDMPLMRQVANARQLLGRFPLSIIELAMRVGVASVFFKSGLTKIASWDLTVQLFDDEYRVPLLSPDVAAYLGTFNELVCSTLVAFGIAARFGAAALLGMTLVIQTFVYPENWSEHLLWASILAYVLSRGPGVLSVDHLIARKMFGDQ
jgi:putative oxidoreductase